MNGTGAIGEVGRQLLRSYGMIPVDEDPGALRDTGLWSVTPLALSNHTGEHQPWFACGDPQPPGRQQPGEPARPVGAGGMFLARLSTQACAAL